MKTQQCVECDENIAHEHWTTVTLTIRTGKMFTRAQLDAIIASTRAHGLCVKEASYKE
jgi:hypothetical protein